MRMQGAWHGSIEKICSSGYTGGWHVIVTALLEVVPGTLRDEATGSASNLSCLCISSPWLICEPLKIVKTAMLRLFDRHVRGRGEWVPRSCRHDLDLQAAPHYACTASASWGGMRPNAAIFLIHRCYAFMFLFPCRPPTDTCAALQRPLQRMYFSLWLYWSSTRLCHHPLRRRPAAGPQVSRLRKTSHPWYGS
jgi:hypothetical protein